MNTCKDCKYIIKRFPFPLNSALCGHPKSAKDAVTGKPQFCEVERFTNLPYRCGKEGRWWESKK